MKSNQLELKKLLGGISPETFLKEYWHKKPLLVRQAIPNFEGILSPEELAGLSCEDSVESRLVILKNGKWYCDNGPFSEKIFSELPPKDWSLLVQSVNHHLFEAEALLNLFNFIPYARLDDLMVSYAPDGGGVGPHFDSYDVFLLQGLGKRIWRISEQKELDLVENAPLRILKNFEMQHEWELEAGDMLYLPPHLAHWGIAVGDCMTYSIGFKAPSSEELNNEFLNYLLDNRLLSGRYADPDLSLQTHPAYIGSAMVDKVIEMLKKTFWGRGDVANFLGCYLTTPKNHIIFDQPQKIPFSTFKRKVYISGIRLDSKSQMLFTDETFYLNGEQVDFPLDIQSYLMDLADYRYLDGDKIQNAPNTLVNILLEWYLNGFVIIPS